MTETLVRTTTGSPIFDELALQYYEEFNDELFTLRIDPSVHWVFTDPNVLPVWENYNPDTFQWEWIQWKNFSADGESTHNVANPGDVMAQYTNSLSWVEYLPDENSEFTPIMKDRMHSVFEPSENMKRSVSDAIDAMIDGPRVQTVESAILNDVEFFAEESQAEIHAEVTADSHWSSLDIREKNQYISDAREEFADEGNSEPAPDEVLKLAKMLFANDSLAVDDA